MTSSVLVTRIKGMAKSFTVKTSGSFAGKSNKLGYGGRAAQMKAHGVPGGVIGAIARSKGEAPGQSGYHGGIHAKVGTVKHNHPSYNK